MKVQMIVQELRRRIYTSLLASLFDAAEQTRATWAKRIESYDAIPEAYREFFVRFVGDAAFPYTVLTPSYAGFIQPTTEKLICVVDRGLYVLEKDGLTCRAQFYLYGEIYHVEVQTVLLDSCITLWGVIDSTPASTAFRFNSVGDGLMAPILETIRRVASGFGDVVQTPIPTDSQPSSAIDGFDAWRRSNYKFMNYARRSLLEGERVLYAILHPEIREKVITILGKSFYRTLAPTQAVIRTDHELIVIREAKRQSGDAKYGGIWDYIPLNKIATLSLSEIKDDLLILSVRLPGDACLNYLFEASAEPEIRPLLGEFLFQG